VKNLIRELNFFDANCIVGRLTVPRMTVFQSAKGLLASMNYFGVREALVHHSITREHHPKVGNPRIIKETKKSRRLHPVWGYLPHHTGEMPEPQKFVRSLLSKGVKAVRIFPSGAEHNFSAGMWCLSDLYDALASYRIPLIIGGASLDYDKIARIAGDFAGLPLIVTDTTYRCGRHVYPLLEKFANFYFDITDYTVHRGLENLVEKFGSDNLLFGTGAPNFSPAQQITNLLYAGIPLSAKRKIAGDNLRRLLKELKEE